MKKKKEKLISLDVIYIIKLSELKDVKGKIYLLHLVFAPNIQESNLSYFFFK